MVVVGGGEFFKRAFNTAGTGRCAGSDDGIIFQALSRTRKHPAYKELTAQARQIIGFNLSLQMYLWLGPVTVTDGGGESL